MKRLWLCWLTRFFWNACVSQMIVGNVSLKIRQAKKRTWANAICSKQWKSVCEIDVFTLLFVYVIVVFLKKYKELWFSKSIWLGPCKVLIISPNLTKNWWLITSMPSTTQKWILLGTCDKTQSPPLKPSSTYLRPWTENELPAGDVWQMSAIKKKC